jgi:hypothetical protein
LEQSYRAAHTVVTALTLAGRACELPASLDAVTHTAHVHMLTHVYAAMQRRVNDHTTADAIIAQRRAAEAAVAAADRDVDAVEAGLTYDEGKEAASHQRDGTDIVGGVEFIRVPDGDVWGPSDMGEVRLLDAPLGRLHTRLTSLLAQYPQHPILCQLCAIIDRIRRLPTNTPIMSLVTGLELLLRKSEQWESYASAEVSLGEHLKVLWTVIARTAWVPTTSPLSRVPSRQRPASPSSTTRRQSAKSKKSSSSGRRASSNSASSSSKDRRRRLRSSPASATTCGRA